jgi:long-chain acyl-CoA synthetase
VRGMFDTLPDLLVAAALHRPDARALTWKVSKWSYSDLARAMDVTAACVRGQQCSPGDRVALLFRNSPHYVAAYYGILSAGCVAVPLNPHERGVVLMRQLEHCGARLLIGDIRHPEWSMVAEAARMRGIQCLDVAAEDESDSLEHYVTRMGALTTAAKANASADDLAMIVYTSGTTGRPKGVMLSHRNLAVNTASIVEYLELHERDRGIAVLPFQFAYGNSVLHTHLAAGAELLLEDSMAFPHAVLQRMADMHVTGFSGVPSTFSILLSRCNLKEFELSALRYVTQAGGPLSRDSIVKLRAQLPEARFFVMYGQTEATARLTYLPPEQLNDKLGSVGIGISGVEIDVVRPDGSRADSCEVGEIVARGPSVMLGYLDDTEGTRTALHGGWLHTGDLGYVDRDRFLYVVGRAAEMIKVGAFRISPQEVEEVIATIPGVADVGVTAVPDDVLGHAIKAVIVLSAGRQMDVRTVKAHCRRNLATYKVPKFVEFSAALPYTTTGKVQRLRLG